MSLLDSIGKSGPIVDIRDENLQSGIKDFTGVVATASQVKDGFFGIVRPGDVSIPSPAPITPPTATPPVTESPKDSSIATPEQLGSPSTTSFPKPATAVNANGTLQTAKSQYALTPSYSMPVSNSTSPFARMNAGTLAALDDATRKGLSVPEFLAQGQKTQTVPGKGGGMPQSTAGAAAGAQQTDPNPPTSGMLGGPPAPPKKPVSESDAATKPLDYKINTAIAGLGNYLMNLSENATGTPQARAQGAVKYLTDNFSDVSKIIFGSGSGQSDAMTTAMNDMQSLAGSFGLTSSVKLPDGDMKTKVTDLAKAILSSAVAGRISMTSSPFLNMGQDFTNGFTLAMLSTGNKEKALIQGSLWAAAVQHGAVTATQKQVDDSTYMFANKNLPLNVPEVSPEVKNLTALQKSSDGKSPAPFSIWSPAVENNLENFILSKAPGVFNYLSKIKAFGGSENFFQAYKDVWEGQNLLHTVLDGPDIQNVIDLRSAFVATGMNGNDATRQAMSAVKMKKQILYSATHMMMGSDAPYEYSPGLVTEGVFGFKVPYQATESEAQAQWDAAYKKAGGASATSDDLRSAWERMGKPMSPEELQTSMREMAHTTHPDMPGGSDEAFKAMMNDYNMLKFNGLPVDMVYPDTSPTTPATEAEAPTKPSAPEQIAGAAPAPDDIQTDSGHLVEPNSEIELLNIQLDAVNQSLADNPATRLWKFANKGTGNLPEIVGKNGGVFAKSGDQIMSNEEFSQFGGDENAVLKAFDESKTLRAQRSELQAKIKSLKEQVQTESVAYANAQSESMGKKLATRKTRDVMSGLDNEKVIAALKARSSFNLQDVISPEALEGLDIRAESQAATGQAALEGGKLEGMKPATTGVLPTDATGGKFGGGVPASTLKGPKEKVSEDEDAGGITSSPEGPDANKIIDRALTESIEDNIFASGKMVPPDLVKGKRASETDKAKMKFLVSQAVDVKSPKYAILIKDINESEDDDGLLYVRDHALGPEVEKLKTSVQMGRGTARQYTPALNEGLLNKILNAYKKTGGTVQDLQRAITGASGKDIKNVGTAGQVANMLVKEFGSPDVNDFHDFLNGVLSGTLDKTTSFELMKDSIMQKVQSTFDYQRSVPDASEGEKESMAELGTYVKGPDGTYTKTDMLPDAEADNNPAELSNHMDLDSQLAEYVGVNVVRAKLPKGVLGMATPTNPGEIKLAKWGHGTLAHEIGGHTMDYRYNFTDGLKEANDPLSQQIAKELVDNFPDASKKNYRPNKWLAEGFATMMDHYLSGDDISQYPLSTKMVGDTMTDQNPFLWNAFQQIRQANINIEKAPALDRANAAAHSNDTPTWDLMKSSIAQKGALKSIGAMADKLKDIYRTQLNSLGYFSDIDKATGIDPKDQDSLRQTALLYQDRKIGFTNDIIRNGVPRNMSDLFTKSPHDVPRITRGLESIFNDVPAQYAEDFKRYLQALRLETENERADAEGRKIEEPLTFKRADITAIKAAVEKEFPLAPKLAKEIDGLYKAFNHFHVEGGRLTEADYMRLNQHPHYTSLQRRGAAFDGDLEYNKMANTIGKHFKGSAREDFVDPFEALQNDLYIAVSAGVDGDIEGKLWDAASTGNLPGLEKITPPVTQVARLSPEETLKAYEQMTGEKLTGDDRDVALGGLRANPDTWEKIFRPRNDIKQPGVKKLWVSGSPHYVQMDRGMTDFLQGEWKKADASWFMKALMPSASLKRMTATVLNPAFMITHAIREFAATLENGERVMDGTYGLSMFTHAGNVIKGYYEFAKGAQGYGKSELYDTLVANGIIKRNSFNENDTALVDKLVENKNGALQLASNVLGKFNKIMGAARAASDGAARIAILSKYNLKDPEELANGLRDAKEAGINFGERGHSKSFFSEANRVNGFLKAGVLATEKGVESMSHPWRMFKTLWPLALASLAVATYADKNGDTQYENQMMSRREASMNVPMANGTMGTITTGGNLPLILAWNLPQIIYYGIKEKDPQLSIDFSEATLGEMTKTDFAMLGPATLQSLMPDTIQQFGALALAPFANVNFFTGNKIIPTDLLKTDPRYQYESYTSNFAVGLSQFLSAMTGGKIKASPILVDNFMQNSLYGTYSFFSGAMDTTLDALHIQPNKLQSVANMEDEAPFLNKFVHDAYTPASQYYVQRAFDLYDQYGSEHTEESIMRKSQDPGLASFQKENATSLKWYPVLAKWESIYSATAKNYRKVEAETGLDDAARAKALSDITDGFLKTTQDTLDSIKNNP